MSDPDFSNNAVVAKCFPTKTYWDDETKYLPYTRECFVKDPTADVLEITHVVYDGYVFDTRKIHLLYFPYLEEDLRYQYQMKKVEHAKCPPMELPLCLNYLAEKRMLKEIVVFANDCKDHAAESAAHAAESAKSAAESAESAAEYAEYAAEYAEYAAHAAESAKSAAEYAEYAAESAKSAAEYAESAAESAKSAESAALQERIRQIKRLREIAPCLNEVI